MISFFDPLTDYSEAERELFNAVGYGDLLNRLSARVLYDMAAHKAFMNKWDFDIHYQEISACIRRGKGALDKGIAGGVFRLTKEFDDLIRF